jgi:predicted metal-binding protein
VSTPAATLLVCTTCRTGEEAGERPGKILFDALQARLAGGAIAVQPIECLSVCKRPCTVALAAPGKWTYVVGDLTLDANLDDILTAAARYGATSDGIVPWRERPLPFRKGVISRTPPLTLLPLAGEGVARSATDEGLRARPYPNPLPLAGEGVVGAD